MTTGPARSRARRALRVVVTVVPAGLLAASLTACTTSKEPPVTETPGTSSSATGPAPTTQAESMSRLKTYLAPVIAAIGPVKEVKMDAVVPCGGSDGSDGYAATYSVWLIPKAGAPDYVKSTLVPSLQAQGWRAELNPRTDETDWSFHKDQFDMGANFHPDTGIVAVGGSGPCLPEKS